MAHNNNNSLFVTINYELSSDNERTKILSDETTKLLSIILQYGISPAIAVIGLVFNTFSIIVLYKNGFHKCSNILLFSLAFLDINFLIGYNNIPMLLYSIDGNFRFLYSESSSFLLYVFYYFFYIMNYAQGLAALCIPMFITIERLVAVFIPLKFGLIITPLRTWIVVACLDIFWIGTMTYTCFWYKFDYVFDQSLNRTVGIILFSDLFFKDLDGIPIFEEMFYTLKIPPLVTIVGCAAIVVKVKITSQKRRKMSSSKTKTSNSKTTKILLVLCIGYIMACSSLAAISYLPYRITTMEPTNIATIGSYVLCIVYCCNSSWNFLVYIALNKNFRDTFKEIFMKPCGKILKKDLN